MRAPSRSVRWARDRSPSDLAELVERLGLKTQDEIDALDTQIDRASREIAELLRRRGPTVPPLTDDELKAVMRDIWSRSKN